MNEYGIAVSIAIGPDNGIAASRGPRIAAGTVGASRARKVFP